MLPTTLKKATCHQNIIGWNNFLRGYISKLWIISNSTTDNIKHATKWCDKLTPLMMQLHKKIWDGCNAHVPGKTAEEARIKAREAIINKVKLIYQKLPKLAP
jgi:hypothetical protein